VTAVRLQHPRFGTIKCEEHDFFPSSVKGVYVAVTALQMYRSLTSLKTPLMAETWMMRGDTK